MLQVIGEVELFRKHCPLCGKLEEETYIKKEILDTRIEALDLSIRSENALNRNGIISVRDLICRTEKDLKRIKNLGSLSFAEIMEATTKLGLTIGWQPAK